MGPHGAVALTATRLHPVQRVLLDHRERCGEQRERDGSEFRYPYSHVDTSSPE
jgi:hypothetical protein